MGRIALLVSREEMLHQAHNILQEKKFRIQEMRRIETENTVIEARRSIADGASIIIARGLQASLIKQYTDIPVVEIVLTAQEMALLVMRSKQIAGRSRPVIAVVGFQNMFCDMSFFDELYEIELRTYYAGEESGLPEAARQAVADGVDVIIGGDTAVSVATEAGVPSLFLSMTEDSMRQAFSMAESLEYAMNVEKKTAAQMETLLDYSFGGIIRLDGDGRVTAVNPVMEDLIGRGEAQLKGKNIRDIVPLIGSEAFSRVFDQGKEYSVFLEWNQRPVYAVMAPVLIEGRVDGAMLTCHRMKRKTLPQGLQSQKDRTSGQGTDERALPPLVRFEDILQNSRAMQDCVRLASLYALSEQPVVLQGEPGTEKRMLAESIHNSSRRGSGPFLDVSCQGLSEDEQRNMIFSDRGAILQARGGTVLLQNAEELTKANQYRLYQLIRFRNCHGGDIAARKKADVRVMVTVCSPLIRLMNRGEINQELYYLLSGLELSLPPLRERREDLRQKIEDTFRDCCERYERYHVLTNGAKKILLEYPWYGNLYQIESFCERLILTTAKRSIDEIGVRELLAGLYGEMDVPDQAGGQSIPADGAGIAEILRKHGGNREKAAGELGISKVTLWRWMKKYGIKWG